MTAPLIWSSPEMTRVVALVCERSGLIFPATRRDSVEVLVQREMTRLGLSDLARYYGVLAEGGVALDALVADLTIGETYFFREPTQLDAIRRDVFPALAERQKTGHGVRIWSAGCASGEEAYTLAIMLGEHQLLERARLIGTDLSRERLVAARRARYGRWSLRSLGPAYTARYFARQGELFVLDPAVRAAVEFRYLNLAEDSYPATSTGIWGMDVILCRNVLIYFDRATIRRVAARLIASLADDGWLYLSASDPPIGDLVPCDVVVTSAGLAYRRPAAASRGSQRTAVVSVPVVAPLEEDSTALVGAIVPHPPPAVRTPLATAAAPAAPDAFPIATAVPAADAPIVQAYAARDFEGVIAQVRHARDAGDDDAALAVLLVRSLANLGRLDEAGRECAAALERHRDCAELLYLHALLLGEARHLRDAATALRRALYLDRHLTVAHLALATLLARLGDRDAAQRSFRNAEALLADLPGDEPVPASDGEPARRLLEIARAQRSLMREAIA